jgi:hypothetical protein
MAYQSINPNDGKLLKCFEHMGNAQLDDALAAAEDCFQTWKHKSSRGRCGRRARGALLADFAEYCGNLTMPTIRLSPLPQSRYGNESPAPSSIRDAVAAMPDGSGLPWCLTGAPTRSAAS